MKGLGVIFRPYCYNGCERNSNSIEANFNHYKILAPCQWGFGPDARAYKLIVILWYDDQDILERPCLSDIVLTTLNNT